MCVCNPYFCFFSTTLLLNQGGSDKSTNFLALVPAVRLLSTQPGGCGCNQLTVSRKKPVRARSPRGSRAALTAGGVCVLQLPVASLRSAGGEEPRSEALPPAPGVLPVSKSPRCAEIGRGSRAFLVYSSFRVKQPLHFFFFHSAEEVYELPGYALATPPVGFFTPSPLLSPANSSLPWKSQDKRGPKGHGYFEEPCEKSLVLPAGPWPGAGGSFWQRRL